jgi:DNA-directed RNA polymerase specialized sigma24 family protein
MPRRDPVPVTNSEDEHLRRFLRARARGDAAGMRRWWEELVIDFADRMDGLVALAHRGQLDDQEHEIAVERALVRFAMNLRSTFRGTSMGELVNATKTLATWICMDVQRASIAARRHGGVSLDEGWDAARDAESSGPSWEGAEAMRRHEDEELGREIADFLAWALPQVKDTRRDVLAMTFQGLELTEICAELDIEPANAYARRSRGMRDLSKLKEQYDT